MHPQEYQRLAANEENYWWFIARRRLLKQCLAHYAPKVSADNVMLDVGCGAGATLTYLRRQNADIVLGLDYSPYALNFCRRMHRGYIGQGDMACLPLADNSLNLVTAMDVLYHQYIPDDDAALREVYRVLKPGGVFILTVPAFEFLRGIHDRTNLTARRYTLPPLRHKLLQARFEIKKESYLFFSLLPFAFVWRKLQQFLPFSSPSDIRPLPAAINHILLSLFLIELRWLKISRLPWGVSLFFVAQR